MRHQADQGTFCQAHALLNIGAIEALSTDGRIAPNPISTWSWTDPKVEEDPLATQRCSSTSSATNRGTAAPQQRVVAKTTLWLGDCGIKLIKGLSVKPTRSSTSAPLRRRALTAALRQSPFLLGDGCTRRLRRTPSQHSDGPQHRRQGAAVDVTWCPLRCTEP